MLSSTVLGTRLMPCKAGTIWRSGLTSTGILASWYVEYFRFRRDDSKADISKATIVMSFILAGSAYWLREKHYDLFLVLHIIMAIIFFVSLWE